MATALRFGPPPAIALEVTPSAEEVAFFAENGFLVVDRLTTDEEIDWLRPVFEAAFEEVDRAAESGEPVPHPKVAYQTMFPELRFPELLQTTYLRNARRYAAALLGAEGSTLSSWGHMIRKPVANNRLAPWHQDEAYWDPDLHYNALASWLPLHDVTVEMGAMQFIPGSHASGVLDHDFYDGDRVHNLLVATDVDVSKAVACPLPKGGATFHHRRTLHFTEPNRTDLPRYAYPIEHQSQPIRRAEPRRWRWVDEHLAATGREFASFYLADGRRAEYGDPR